MSDPVRKCESDTKWLLSALSVELSVTVKPALLLLDININNKGLITPLTSPCDNETKPCVHLLFYSSDSLCLLDAPPYTSLKLQRDCGWCMWFAVDGSYTTMFFISSNSIHVFMQKDSLT